jgi:hypothetical protein
VLAPTSVFRPEAYLVQLERLRAKARERRHVGPTSEGLSVFDLSGADHELCAVLAREVEHGEYRFGALKRSEVFLEGKRRIVHGPDLADVLVLGATAARLTGLLESVLLDSVHAYRPGRSSLRVLGRLRQYLDEHRGLVEKKSRGLFVLQRDLSAYGESIPTDSTSRLWPLLDDVLRRIEDPRERTTMRQLIEAGCRPQILLADGRTVAMDVGIPTGSPIQQPLANLYLAPLDEILRARSGFHARFGDDLFVATPNQSEAQAIAEDVERVVLSLHLRFNVEKSKNLYFTKPGRPLEAPSPFPVQATSHLEYLGVRMDFDGRMGLSRKRSRQLLLRSRWRIQNSARLAPKEHAREYVAKALQHALTANDSVSDPLVAALTTWVDDRQQLRQLDRQLAQRCAEVLGGKRGVRAFRHTSVSDLRAAGLSSLLELRRRRSPK